MNKQENEKTYMSIGMSIGMAIGAVIGSTVVALSSIGIMAVPMGLIFGMLAGMTIGSCIKRKETHENESKDISD